ncbi:hypothetical protein BDQ12DRAFT_724428 [Crucibulum laeve]|uniref:Uncharacterized protein n=1 Tax=Crucibulum laeve TaxID=68775 RepID=A0A5C3LWA3_9AGAR|nr:hypothetical protein BDQ12DRAFT_724428 [Crucibulum laeve]
MHFRALVFTDICANPPPSNAQLLDHPSLQSLLILLHRPAPTRFLPGLIDAIIAHVLHPSIPVLPLSQMHNTSLCYEGKCLTGPTYSLAVVLLALSSNFIADEPAKCCFAPEIRQIRKSLTNRDVPECIRRKIHKRWFHWMESVSETANQSQYTPLHLHNILAINRIPLQVGLHPSSALVSSTAAPLSSPPIHPQSPFQSPFIPV